MSDPIRVLLVDDDPLVRGALALLLGAHSDLAIVGEAGDGDEALDAAEAHHPDVVLMDIRMPRRDGLSAATELLGRPDPPKVVMLTTIDSDDLVLRALAAGAHGFILKDTPPDRMVEAVRAVTRGEPILSPRVTQQLIAVATRGDVDDRRRVARAELDLLSERELEVAVAVGRGASNAEIARQLFMSVATVKTYLARVFVKLGIDNRVQLAMRVHDAGLL